METIDIFVLIYLVIVFTAPFYVIRYLHRHK